MTLQNTSEQTERSVGSALVVIFLIALAIRWIYAVALYAWIGTPSFLSGDSYKYLQLAQELVDKLATGGLHSWDGLGGEASRMPMYLWLLASNIWAAGELAPFTAVLCQGVIDAGTCLFVYGIASSIFPRHAFSAGVAASFNPTQIVLSALVYTDTLFLFFAAISLFGAVRWLRSATWRSAAIIAVGLGAAALTRIFIVLWSPILLLFLLAADIASKRFQRGHLFQLTMIGVFVVLSVAPIVARNISQFGVWTLTPQGGGHLVHWIVPLVKESQDGTPWAAGAALMETEFRRRFPDPSDNPFIESQRYSQFGREMLSEFGLQAIAKAWMVGAAINLGAPAIIIAPPVAQLPRTGFYDTKAASVFEKIRGFLFRSDNVLYAWILLIGVTGVAIIRLLQLIGFFALLGTDSAIAPILLLVLWIGYILAVNGPIASPKYRLPIEPALMVFTGAGYCAVRRWFGRATQTKPVNSLA